MLLWGPRLRLHLGQGSGSPSWGPSLFLFCLLCCVYWLKVALLCDGSPRPRVWLLAGARESGAGCGAGGSSLGCTRWDHALPPSLARPLAGETLPANLASRGERAPWPSDKGVSRPSQRESSCLQVGCSPDTAGSSSFPLLV